MNDKTNQCPNENEKALHFIQQRKKDKKWA
jgi:hypothetical protein